LYNHEKYKKRGITMIKLENISKSYVKGKKSVDSLNLEIKDGEIFGFLGPNGAGKTTTIKMITGILNADEGKILVDDKDIKKDSISAKKTIGFVPDTPDIFLKLKGIEYLNFMGDIYEVPKEIRKQRIEDLTKKFEIYDNLNEEMQGYSHGMRQKIILCGALLNNPKNWILDEPMTGLDPKASYDLKEMMRKHAKEGNCVFFSTHVLEVAEKLCDRVGIINKGKLIFVGTFEEMKTKLKDNGTLEELFLEITQDE
jgi:ABC-2 type transport system ATP-binding protein